MLAVGLIVLVHGDVLLTPPDRLGSASSPLMIGYATVMLAIQGLFATGTMGMGSLDEHDGGMGGSSMTSGMGWDAGMVVLAALMLATGSS